MFQAALASGLAVTQAPTRESGNHLPAAESASALFERFAVCPDIRVGVCAPQVGGQLFASPNAIRSAPPPTTSRLFPQPVRATICEFPRGAG